jgi:hypothetical protein
MALPRAVQAQGEEADRIQQALAAAAAQAAGVQTPTDESPAADSPAFETSAPQLVTPQQPAPAPVPQEPAAQPQPAKAEDWEQKYRSLRGLYEQQVPQLRAELRQRDERLAGFEQRMQEMEKRTPVSATTPTQPSQKLVTQQDVEAYGADLIDLIKRAAQESVPSTWDQERQELLSKVAQLESKVGSVSTQSQTAVADAFWAGLERRVPDWQTLNTDQSFLQWLTERIPGTPVNRQSILDEANARWDANAVAEVFDEYKATHARAPAPVAQPAAPSLQSQVAPSRTRAAAPQAPTQERVWTSKDIGEFYQQVRRGVIRPEDAARIEGEINAAVSAGRVVV